MPKKRYMESARWNKQFTPWGDRLDFLPPEKRHLATGQIRILPPRHPEKRERGES